MFKHPAHPDYGMIVAPRKSGGGGGSSNPTQTTVQKADPWSGQQAALNNVFGTATGLSGLGGDGLTSAQQTAFDQTDDFTNSDQQLSYYDGPTVAPFSDDTLTAFDMQRDRAMGSPLEGAAQQQMTDTLAGDYLEAGNPYFTEMMDSVAGDVRSRMDAQFGASGRYGSGAHANATADALADVTGQLAYKAYGDERTNQQRAAFAAPSLAEMDYRNIAALGDIGGQQEALQQALVNEDIDRFNYDQMEPYTRLGLYNQFVQGNYGGQGTATTTGTNLQRGSSTGNVLGGALSGAGLGGSVGGPWGAAIGGIGGGLLGLF